MRSASRSIPTSTAWSVRSFSIRAVGGVTVGRHVGRGHPATVE
jgi:hypothetical protein